MFQSGLQADIFGSSERNFADWVTTSRRRCSSLRRTLARLTSGSGFSSSAGWPTSAAGDAKNTRNATARRSSSDSQHHDGETLCDATQNWATPQAHDLTARGAGQVSSSIAGNRCLAREGRQWPSARAEDSESAGNHPNATDSLTGAAKGWPTPKARDVKGMSQRGIHAPEDALENSIAAWATPNVPNRGPEKRASKAARGSGGVDTQTQAMDFPCSRPDEPTTPPGLSLLLAVWTPPACQRLSVDFQHWLMGWPSPIRSCFDSAAMELYRWRLESRLSFFYRAKGDA